ncbi:MAG: hypothetical protein ATN35_04320 [Epulopiscium sp. Nele67-Bin004]|nr:MAG: hypothetical protein ATN35_04320 [Epulopiscium sp. Nele67-Bin004]
MLSKKIRIALVIIGSAMGVIAIAPTDVFATTGQVQETTETSDNFEAKEDALTSRSRGTLAPYDGITQRNFGISTSGYYDIVIENLSNKHLAYTCTYNVDWF